MPKELPGITYEKEGQNATIDSPNSMYLLQFIKKEEYFSNPESKHRFLSKCEGLVRGHKRYKKYKNFLMKEVGLNHCQVWGHLSSEDVTLEMHHGPIFTLYELCEIITDHFLKTGEKITTFRVADRVLKEHEKHRVMVVMLAVTIHQEVHDREIFINMKQAWGWWNFGKFLKTYGLNKELKEKYDRYYDKSMMMDSTTYELLKLNDKLFEKEE